MQTRISNWSMNAERGPSCLSIKPTPADSSEPNSTGFADQIWQLLCQHLTYRLVLDMEAMPTVSAGIRDEMYILKERIEQHNGLMKLCNLSEEDRAFLFSDRLKRKMTSIATREEALMNSGCSRPR